MVQPFGIAVAGCLLTLLVSPPLARAVGTQSRADEPAQAFSRVESLDLPPATSSTLNRDLHAHDYLAAEKLLLPQIQHDPQPLHAARLLAFLGGIYFLGHDYLNAAVAWNKSQAITPLPDALRFSLAMTYIRMGRPDWARNVLESLAATNPRNALYPYWLGRLNYDAHQYDKAILNFTTAIGLSPTMSRAYNNRGLCYFYLNQNSLAVADYKKAIELERTSPQPSAWPYLNLAITLRFMNHPEEAEANLHQAIQIDPRLAQAHFQLGNILEQTGKLEAAIDEFAEAARLDSSYAEPHYALARIYRRLGRKSLAQEQVQVYLRIHGEHPDSNTPPTPGAHPEQAQHSPPN
jgi:tetratricopeptide (TPR) repeat protein